MKRLAHPKLQNYPGVYRSITRTGKHNLRFLKNGYSHLMRSKFGTPEFDAEYRSCLEEVKKRQTFSNSTPGIERGTMAWLVVEYRRSARYACLRPDSKRTVTSYHDFIRDVAGDLPFMQMKPHHIQAILDKKVRGPAANGLRAQLVTLFNFARAKGWVASNPAKATERRKVEETGGYHTLEDWEVEKYLAAHPPGSLARLVFRLLEGTGAARQDCAAMGWHSVKDGCIRYARGKTNVEATIPIGPELIYQLIKF
jgi:hypothetical protein